MNWVEVATLDDLPSGASLEFEAGGRTYALFRSGDEVTCLGGLCPHQGGRLASGSFDGSRVVCPRRGCLRWSFEVRTGASSVGKSLTAASHPVRRDERAIFVGLPDD